MVWIVVAQLARALSTRLGEGPHKVKSKIATQASNRSNYSSLQKLTAITGTMGVAAASLQKVLFRTKREVKEHG